MEPHLKVKHTWGTISSLQEDILHGASAGYPTDSKAAGTSEVWLHQVYHYLSLCLQSNSDLCGTSWSVVNGPSNLLPSCPLHSATDATHITSPRQAGQENLPDSNRSLLRKDSKTHHVLSFISIYPTWL